MQVVHSERHRAHAPTVETYLGLPLPANEGPARADAILAAMSADGGFDVREPTEHGLGPIRAIHDAGLVAFLEQAWPEATRQRIDRDFLVADTYPTRGLFEGM